MKDEIRLKKRLDKYILKPSELTEGMYVGRINFRESRIDNKYIIVGKKIKPNGNDSAIAITCYDFIENKLVDFTLPLFSFLRGSEDNDDFYYKFKYSTLDEYKKFNIGDKVIFINPKNIKTRSNPVFKIVKKQKKQGDCGRFDLMDNNGFVIHNVPGILLLKEVNGKEEIKMKKDDLFTNFEDYVLDPYDLHVGMFVAKINFKEKLIENKYVISSIMKYNNEIINRVECFDFVQNIKVTFDGFDIFTFLKANLNNKDEFQYKYEYSSHDYFEQLKVGDEVEFVQPIGFVGPNWIFKVIEKSQGKLTYDHCTLESRLGEKFYGVPAALLNPTLEEKTRIKFNRYSGNLLKQLLDCDKLKDEPSIYSISSTKSKTPTKLKFTIDIDYTNDSPIKLKLNEEGHSYSRKTAISASLDEKIKVLNVLKDISWRDIFRKYIKNNKDEEVKLISGKSKYWRFNPFNFKQIESRLYDESDLTCKIDIKIGNVFKSKMDLIISNNSESKVANIKEKLAKYILEH